MKTPMVTDSVTRLREHWNKLPASRKDEYGEDFFTRLSGGLPQLLDRCVFPNLFFLGWEFFVENCLRCISFGM